MSTPNDTAPAAASPTREGSLVYLVLICFVATLGGLLFGYDTAVISGAIGFLETRFDLSSTAVGWAASSALAGCVLGCVVAGWMNDRLGRKKVLLLCAVLFIISAVGSAIPERMLTWITFGAVAAGSDEWVTNVLWTFTIFRLIGGIGVGAASMTSPMYIAEISPASIRGRMVSLNQLAIVSGMLVVFFVNYHIGRYGTSVDQHVLAPKITEHGATLDPQWAADYAQEFAEDSSEVDVKDPESLKAFKADINEIIATNDPLRAEVVIKLLREYKVNVDETDVQRARFELASWNETLGWRWMFASEVLPAFALLLFLFLVPESPRWLTKQGRQGEALAVLSRINGPQKARREVAAIEETISLESGSLAQLLAPGMRIVLVIGVALAVLQQVTGINVFLYFGPRIFEKIVGSESDVALLQTVVVGVVNLTFTIIAIWTVDRIGRKPLMLIGFAGMGFSLLAMGLAAYFDRTDVWVLTFILTYIASFALSVGPVTWVILSEIFPTRIRGRALAIATICLWASNFVVSQTYPMMGKNEWLVANFHHAFPFWLYCAMCLVAFIFMAIWVPETKQRSLEEIEKHWLVRENKK
jgi:MFS family permease